MRYRNLTLILGFLLFSLTPLSRAEHEEGKEAPPKTGERSTAPNEVTDDMYKLLAKFNPSLTYLVRRFAKTLPDALSKSMAAKTDGGDVLLRSDEEIAKDVAELVGQISDTQKEQLYQEISKESRDSKSEPISGCNSPDAEKRAALDALRTRFIWALDFVLEKSKGAPRPLCKTRYDEFISEFKKAYEKVSKENDEFHEKVKLALEGNKEAIDFVKNKYGRDAVMGFLENHSEFGNKELANNLAKVLAEKNGNDHFLHGVTPSGEQVAVVLGNDPKKFAERIVELKKDPEVKGISSFVQSEKPAENPRYIVPESLKKGFKPPLETATLSDAAKPAGKPVSTPNRGNAGANPAPRGTEPSSAASASAIPAGALKVLKDKCASCHAPGMDNYEDFKMEADGTVKDKLARVKARGITKGTMPPEAPLNASEKAELLKWLNAAGVK